MGTNLLCWVVGHAPERGLKKYLCFRFVCRRCNRLADGGLR